MMQHQVEYYDGANPDGLKDLTPRTEVGDDASMNRPSDVTPSAPAARNRFPLVRTGTDSGYGTDYSPSPSSSTSTRRFTFDDIVNGRNTPTQNGTNILSERLRNIQSGSVSIADLTSNGKDDSVADIKDLENDADEEVFAINSQNSVEVSEKDDRPSAPHPCSQKLESVTGNALGRGDGTYNPCISVPIVPTVLRLSPDNTNSTSHKPTGSVVQQTQNKSDKLTRDCSYSLPEVEVLRRVSREMEVGRELRRMSDEFFYYHCNRRRRSTISIGSSPSTLQVNINVYAGASYSDRRADEETEDHTDLNSDEQ